jgi:cobalt/nickel transport protein
MKTTTKLWIGIAILAALSPIGLYLPEKLKAGSAWGEWGTDQIKGMLGYIPSGLEKVSSIWNAILPDYAFKGWEEKALGHQSIAYIISAIIGIVLCIGGAWLIGKLLTKKEQS